MNAQAAKLKADEYRKSQESTREGIKARVLEHLASEIEKASNMGRYSVTWFMPDGSYERQEIRAHVEKWLYDEGFTWEHTKTRNGYMIDWSTPRSIKYYCGLQYELFGFHRFDRRLQAPNGERRQKVAK
jgi:hypothetical protein